MPLLCANLMYMFTELPPMQRFKAAAEAGFRLVEYQFPYDLDATQLKRVLDDNGLRMALINAPSGDRSNGERGLAALPGRIDDFRDSILLALAYARELQCPRIHVMAGIVDDDEREIATATYAENLRVAAQTAGAAGIGIVIEPINGIDVPGYLLQWTAQARAMIAMIGEQNILLQYDAYHALMNEEDPMEGLRANLDVIAHIQIAGYPGRAEPIAEGCYDMGAFIELADMLGYSGAIGCEYNPANGTLAGLHWASRYGIGV
ncbi:TIM barrel protein [Thalassospiraceae bacterium LMO-JJ14]|nr:TIM barrel protein [Thalassospiraceae bacterium LMO-JJ14]